MVSVWHEWTKAMSSTWPAMRGKISGTQVPDWPCCFQVKGDFIIQAATEFLGAGTDPHRKMGLIVRAALDPKSAHVNACIHGNGGAALQFRRADGAVTDEIHIKVEGPDEKALVYRGGETIEWQVVGN